MRRRILFGLAMVAVVALVSVAALADDTYLATPHALAGPHFHQYMVVRPDLNGGSESKPTPPPVIPSKVLPSPEMTAGAGGKGPVRGNSGSVLMATASPEVLLESRLRSLAHELR